MGFSLKVELGRIPAGLILYMEGLFVPTEILKAEGLNTNEKLVLSVYWYYTTNGTLHKCTMTNSQIAEQIGLSERIVQRSRKRLKELGCIYSGTGLSVTYIGVPKMVPTGTKIGMEGYQNWHHRGTKNGTHNKENKERIKTNKEPIAVSTYSHRCGNESDDGDKGQSYDTSFFVFGSVEPDGRAENPSSKLERVLDSIEYGIENNFWQSDVSFDLAFNALEKENPGLDINYDYLRDKFDKHQSKIHSINLSRQITA